MWRAKITRKLLGIIDAGEFIRERPKLESETLHAYRWVSLSSSHAHGHPLDMQFGDRRLVCSGDLFFDRYAISCRQ